MFLSKNEQKAGEKERLYFNCQRWNAGWSGVKRKIYIFTAHSSKQKREKFNVFSLFC